MKKLILNFIALSIPILSFSQLKYDDIIDLTTICKKEDFSAVKVFLKTKNFTIETFNTNYDHGSYVVLCDIKASYLGEEDITNSIEINYDEYDSYKKLAIYQNITTDKEYKLSSYRIQPFWSWNNENWTTVFFSKNARNNEQYLGYRMYSFNFEDTSLRVIERQKLGELIKNQNFEKNIDGYDCYFVNSNPQLGDLKYNIITYQSLPGNLFAYSLVMWKKFLKGQNVSEVNNKILEIPLVRNGKIFSLNIKFGKLVKKYILDSGASDMSIDTETYDYFESTDQLKIENRLTDSKYQLADGSVVQFKRVRIPNFNINGIDIKNIDATIIANGKPLLLGKSFLDSFKSWKIDNEKQVLVVELF